MRISLPDKPDNQPRAPEGASIIGKSGVPYRDTFDVLDSSKIQTFMDCPRKFFYRHILGWQTVEPNVHLVFGSAWHEAMEYLMLHGHTKEGVQGAYNAFRKKWREGYPNEHMEPDHYAKNLGNALDALVSYATKWPLDFDVLYTEIAGSCPIDEDQQVHFKLDTIVEDETGIWSYEHKTTGRRSQSWMEKWEHKFQVSCYTHVLHCFFPPPDVQGVKINGAILRKKSNEFVRVPVRKPLKQMDAWLWQAQYWVQQIQYEMERLAECSPSDSVMRAFPQNTESCTKFGCPFSGMCDTMTNPLQRQEEPPPGYHREFWDPRERAKEARYVAEADLTGKSIKKNEDKQGE